MAKDEKKEAEYSKPASLVDLEERQERENESQLKVHTAEGGGAHAEDDGQARDYGENAGDPAYIGVDPMYAVYANDTEKPGRAEEGPEKVLEDAVYENLQGDAEGEEGQDYQETAGFSGSSDKTPAGDPSAVKKASSSKSSK